MNNDHISLRQFLILTTVALLPQMIKLVPGQQANAAGRSGWLAGLAALVPMLIVLWLICRVGQALPEKSGLGELLCLCLGDKPGRLLCGVYGIWLVVLGCFELRFCGERFIATLYPNTGTGLVFVAILSMAWWLGQKQLVVTARAGQIFFYAVLVMVGSILLFTAGEIHLYNIWPVWTQQLPGLVRAGGGVLNALSLGIGLLFLFHQVTDRREGFRLAARWAVGVCLGLTALGIVVMGTFGAEMVARMQIPFFSLAKEVKLEEAVERVEPVVAAAWVFADLILVSVLLRAAEGALSKAIGEEVRGMSSALALILLPGAYLIAGSVFALEQLYNSWGMMGKNLLFFGIPLLSVAVGKMRRVL